MWDCQANSRAAKPIGNVSDVPPHTWHTLGSDLFYWNKIDYLVIGDYFSKYLIVRRLPNSSSLQGLYLLILSFRLKHNRGTLKEKPTHVLLKSSVS